MEKTDSHNLTVTVAVTVNKPIELVWQHWSEPAHITQWCQASPEWHAPAAENDLRTGGRFKTTMAAKDGSMSFDFSGTYTEVVTHKKIAYALDDDRKVDITFEGNGTTTTITETFEAESTHPIEMQQAGWQAIMDSFKKYSEG